MKLIITFLCGTLCTWNFCAASADLVAQNDDSKQNGGGGCYNFYFRVCTRNDKEEYKVTIKDHFMPYKKRATIRCLGDDNFWGFCICNVNNNILFLDDKFATEVKNVVENDMACMNVTGLIDTRACTVRKFMLDVFDMSQQNSKEISLYVDIPELFFLFPNSGKHKSDVELLMKELHQVRNSVASFDNNKIIVATLINEFCLWFFSTGNIEYDLKIVEFYTPATDSDPTNKKLFHIMQVIFNTDDLIFDIKDYIVQNLQQNFSANNRVCPGKNVDDVYKYFQKTVHECEDNVFAGMSKMYLGIPIPDDKYDEAKSIVDGINNMRQTWISRAFNSIFSWFGW